MVRNWTYSYKTSDGLRHEDEMVASSKDEVYARLRSKGIRAIKVSERITPIVRSGFRGLRKRDWVIMCLFLCVGVFGCWWFLHRSTGLVQQSAGEKKHVVLVSDPAYMRLDHEVNRVMVEFRKRFYAVDRELISNYRLAMRPETSGDISAEILRGRSIVDAARNSVLALYKKYYGEINKDSVDAVDAAQRRYGEVMSEIDVADEGLDGDECALELLTKNRGAWRVDNGDVVWRDAGLEREFSVFRRAGIVKNVQNISLTGGRRNGKIFNEKGGEEFAGADETLKPLTKTW